MEPTVLSLSPVRPCRWSRGTRLTLCLHVCVCVCVCYVCVCVMYPHLPALRYDAGGPEFPATPSKCLVHQQAMHRACLSP